MTDIRQLITDILNRGYLLSTATVDDGGVWVSDVIYVHDAQMNLYWLSQTAARHSKAIVQNSQVAGTVTVSNNPGESNIGLQITGVAEKIEGDIFEIATAHRQKRGKPPPTRLGEILEEGESWYCLRPKMIELTYEPLFGFNKQKIEL